ncbi:MAG TPA: TolC family protein, partial [Flavobacterium sp.]|nr:TolC family protein [Flavobacterium sp.]
MKNSAYKLSPNPLLPIAIGIAKKALRTLRLSTFLLITTFSQAQQIISLEKAIELAKSNNIDLKIADKEIEKQTVLKKTAFQADPLQVQYQGGQFNSADFDHNVSVQQYFPIGNITKANRQLQEELVKLAEKRKALSSYEIEKAVTLAYYQYLYGVSIQKLNSELNDIYIKFLKNAELRFQTGESRNIEVISAKAKVKEIETQKAQLEYDLAIYQKQLQFFVQT